MRLFRIALLFLCVASCAPIRVNYDFDKSVNFAKYKTYNYYKDMKTGLSELDTKRFLKNLSLKMEVKGFLISGQPDFFIDIKSNEIQATQRNTVGVGLGGGGSRVGGGVSLGIPIGQAQINREIIIDFVDEKGIGLFWQAVTESSFNPNATPEKREERLKTVLEKVLVQYPPKQ